MKTILAYGDSLTYGSDPGGGPSDAYDAWTAAAGRNGARILPTILASHAPLVTSILGL